MDMTTGFLPLMLGFAIMAVASIAIYARGSKRPEIRHHTQFHSAVPFLAATAYLAMALGVGKLEVEGETIYLARYLDWAVTTPILLTGLAMTGLHEHGRHSSYILPVVALDVVMIGAGLLSAIADTAAERWIWYGWSCAAFCGVLYVLWIPVRRLSAQMGGAMDGVYVANLTFVTLVWLAYPIVFLAGPQGLGIVGEVTDIWAILLLDVVSKVVYGLLATARLDRIPTSELRELA